MIGQFNMPNIALLLSMGYSVTIAANFSFGNTFSDNDSEDLLHTLKAENIEVHNVKFDRNIFSFNNISAYKQVKKLIDENNYSLIHCHSPIGSVVARLAAKKHRKSGTHVTYSAHGFHFYKGAPILNWLIYYPIEKWLSKYTDALITINTEDYVLAKQKMKAKNIYYTHGVGVDKSKFSVSTIDRKTKLQELGLPKDATVMISIGELSKRKNHQAAIKAISRIKEDNLYYIICGQGKLKGALLNLCKRLKVENRVLFLGYRTDTADLLHMSDVFVFPSLQEGLPVALMEAMMSGLPCVVSKIRGNVDLLEHGKGGFICDVNKADEYSEAIKTVLKNRDMGKYNQSVMQKFNTETVMEQMKGIYIEGLNISTIPGRFRVLHKSVAIR